VPGPWEGEDEACGTAAVSAHDAVVNASNNGNLTACQTDQDCTDLSLDLPCFHSCETVPATTADIPAITSAIAEATRTYCDAAPVSCATHAIRCSPTTDQNACIQGRCTRVNLETSGCSDACSCEAERSAAFYTNRGDCAGPDLWIIVSTPCKSCGRGGGWLVIGNRGDATFSGAATLSFDVEGSQNAPLTPPTRSLDLMLDPGGMTKPIYVESRGEVYTRPRITGAGDCAPENDAASELLFPAAQVCQ